MQENNSISISAGVSVIIFLLLYSSTNLEFYSILGITQFFFFSSKFFFDLGKKIEIRDLMIIMGSLQWIVGPALAYSFNYEDPIFYMSVDQETYMDFVFPATLAFAIALYLPIFSFQRNDDFVLSELRKIVQRYPNLDLLLIAGSTFLDLIAGFFPGSLAFFIYLLGNFRFVGLYFLILRNRPYKWLIFGFVTMSFVSLSFRHAMFHNMLLWFGFLLIVIAYIYRISILKKAIISAVLVLLVVTIQLAKGSFRTASGSERTVGLFYEIAVDNFEDTQILFSEAFINYNINRINQGWIIARIMGYMPENEPYADGETIWRAIKSSIVPRFLDPSSKVFAGHSEYFQRFTGLKLASGTSMDLSILGEAYANYGVFGGIVTMFFLGLFYNFIFFKILKGSFNYPSLLFMLPIMFLQVIKAETDFATTLNFLVKGSMVVVGVLWGMKTFFGMKI